MKQIIGIILIIGCTLLGCKKDNLPFYRGEKALMMMKPWDDNQTYSYTESGVLSVDRIHFEVPLVLIGADEGDTTIQYTIRFFSEDLSPFGYSGSEHRLDTIFKGENYRDTLYFTVLRDRAFMDTLYSARILLETAPEYRPTKWVKGVDVYTREWEIHIEDRFEEPEWWEDYEAFLGKFTSRKMREIAHWQGLTSWLWEDLSLWLKNEINRDPLTFGNYFRAFLDARLAAGEPILERNGSPMRAGPAVY